MTGMPMDLALANCAGWTDFPVYLLIRNIAVKIVGALCISESEVLFIIIS